MSINKAQEEQQHDLSICLQYHLHLGNQIWHDDALHNFLLGGIRSYAYHTCRAVKKHTYLCN